MKKLLLFTVILMLLASCSGRKQIEKTLHSGNYDQAIEDALRKLENNKDKDRKQDFVIMLEDAYYKAVERDMNDISHMKKDANPELYQAIYERYLDLNARQEAIKPVLPLQIGGKTIQLQLKDYNSDIIASRDQVADYMYDKGLTLLESEDKSTIRKAYEVFSYVDNIYPNYEDIQNLLNEAHDRGTDYILVSIENQTQQIIPDRLEADLLDFDTYGLNQFWTIYHANANTKISYDYAMKLQLKNINISPDELHEKETLKEKKIVDGWKYQLDSAGNVVKDSLGNDVKIDNIINARARYFEFNQFKSTQLLAEIIYVDLKNNQTLDAFPIESGFIFENRYATFRGDQRALNKGETALLNNKQRYFPDNAQMVFDTGEDLKLKLKQLISTYKIRT